MTGTPCRRLAIIGVGLLGGSIARGARTRGLATEIVGIGRSADALAAERAARAIDAVATDVSDGVRGADLVVLCTPVGTLPDLVRAAWPHLAPGSVLTDVGSVKAGVVSAADACPPRAGVAFIGSHPMAGSERSGFDAADPDLFEGRLVILTPIARTPAGAVARITAFWEALGAHVRCLDVEAHDRGVAAISHLPHLAAYGLVGAAGEDALGLAGRGFADTTRIAASAESLWMDIVRGNRGPVLAALAGYRDLLGTWEAMIREGRWADLETELGRARALREKLG